MIRVLRSRNDDNGNPIKPPDSWFTRAATKTAQAKEERENHDPDPDTYGHVDLRRAILELFYGKCAYCESRIAGVFDWEVEHFRPKGRVAERENHPGYYWLTYEWDNLYTGCTYCNQRRRDRGTWEDPQVGEAGGKLAQFPLRDESKRAMDHNGDIRAEEPVRLLIDPCKDNPETELTFDMLGRAQAIGSGDRATETIKVLHLNRRDLSRNRRLHVAFVRELVEQITQVLGSGATCGQVRDVVLSEHARDDRPYAGVVRAILRDPDAFGV
jgi:uncharacterized protein (TIGR02646 family)